MDVEKLQVVISAKVKPLQDSIKQVQGELKGLENTTKQANDKMSKSFDKSVFSVSKLKVGLAALGVAAVKAGKAVWGMGTDAVTVDNQIVSLGRTMGDSTNEFMEWARTSATAFGISEKTAVQFGGQFSSIIARTQESGKEVAGLTEEMLKLGSVVAANTHFDIDDVMGRLRSGLSGRNEAIEDLGIEVKPHVIQGTQAYADAVRQGGVAWKDMTDAQQANVRMQAIIEQGQNRYGMALQGTAQTLAQLRAQIGNMTLAWGRAFAPIVDFVIPILSTLVGWLTTAAAWAQALLSIFFKVENKTAKTANTMKTGFAGVGNPIEPMNNSLGKANKQAKELQKTLFGFDVIHNVAEPVDTPDVGGGGGGGGGGMGIPEFDTSGLDTGVSFVEAWKGNIEEIQAKIEVLKEKFRSILPVVAGIIAGFAGFKILKGLWELAGGAFTLFTGPLKVLNPLMKALMGPLENLGILVFGLGDKLLGLVGISSKTASAMTVMNVGFAAIAAVIALVVAALVTFYQKSETFRNTVSTAIQGVVDIFISLWEGTIKPIFEMVIGTAKAVWEYGIKPLWDSFVDFIGAIATLLLNIWNSVLQPLIKWFVDVFGPIIAVVINAVVAVFGILFIAASAIFSAILDVLTVVINWVSGFFEGTWKDVFGRIGGFFTGLWNIIAAVVGWIWDKMKILIDWVSATFGPSFKVGLDFVVNVFKIIWNSISGIVSGIITTINGIIDFIVGVFTGDWSRAWDGVKAIFSNMWNGLTAIVKTVWNTIIGMFTAGGQIFKGIAEAISNIFKKVVNHIIGGINKVVAWPFEKLNSLLDTMRAISILGAKPFSWLPSIAIPQIPQFATGGFPEDGLFFANSNELVGKFTNGKTAVANNDQIIAGVSTGVANAVAQVLAGGNFGGNGQPINLTVQIGSNTIAKEIINSIDDYTMRTGITFKTV